MSNQSQVVALVNSELKSMTEDFVSTQVAEERTRKCLLMCAVVNDRILRLQNDLSKHQTLLDTQHAEAIRRAKGGVTEKKLEAAADIQFTQARELFEMVNAEIYFLKKAYEIFNNLHIKYRQGVAHV